ncbi:MAG: DUF2235 domain-containing protein [Leptospiraceae bacterium]|nr:DUF2235 domain-containing protein [Leptospiraceae bacterium]
MKTIVILSDGTWQGEDQKSNNAKTDHPSNVVFTKEKILDEHPDTKIKQCYYYDEGINGTNFFSKIYNGMTGNGLDQNILDCYKYLINNYEPGDQIYLFGYSRGAFTVRSLAGMIRKCGILKKTFESKTNDVWNLYRSGDKPNFRIPSEFRKSFSIDGEVDTEIKFIGVWDTVGSLGIPYLRSNNFTTKKYEFHDHELNKSVKNAFHAIAIDETRKLFTPTLWDFIPKKGQKVEQRWFVGVHANIGGGISDRELSDISLEWMLSKAKEVGLGLDNFSDTLSSNHLGKIAHAHFLFSLFDKKEPRVIGFTFDEHTKSDIIDKNQTLDPSVTLRFQNDPNYRPTNLIEYISKFALLKSDFHQF